MTLDEAIKHCEEVTEEKKVQAWEAQLQEEYGKVKSCKECAEEHRQLANWLKDYKRLLAQEPKWIPVSERLPEENKTVIASTKYGVYPEARYTEENGWEWAYESGADYWEKLEDVEAWMPLSKPYEPKERSE